MRFQNQNRNVFKPRAHMGPGLVAALFLLFAQVMAWSQQPQVSSINKYPSAVNTPKQVMAGTAKLVKAYEPSNMLRLAISIKAPHMDAEEKFLKELQDRNSPNFKKYLTPEQWNARFAPAAQDEQAVVDWATSHGLTITARYPNRLMVNVEGTVDTIEKAFNININNYEVNGEVEFSNDRDPVIPGNLVGIIQYVDGLNSILRMQPANPSLKAKRGPDYVPGPMHQIGKTVQVDADPDAAKAVKSSGKQIGSQITNGAYDPHDIWSSNGYDFDALQAQGHCCNPLHNAGQTPPETTIALATDGDFADSDFQGFHNAFPYLAGHYGRIFVNGTPSCCDTETTLDLEWSTATSNSQGSYVDTSLIWVYEAAQGFGDFGTLFQQIANDNYVRVVNISYGLNESYLNGYGLVSSWHSIFNQMLGQGMTIMAAAGDNGAATGCGDSIATIYPGSDPDVVSVGGTQLVLNSDGTFNKEVTWTGDTWSGACTHNYGGTGGGCSSLFAAPGYQTNNSNSPACGTGSRSVPDIALNASPYPGQSFYFGGELTWEAGTSIASPMMTGFVSQANAYLDAIGLGGAPVGQVNYKLYWAAEHPADSYEAHYPFYDVTSGCNSNDITNAYGLGSYCAGTGYDLTTGWGSFNALQLAWAINTYDLGDFKRPVVTFSGPISTIGSTNWFHTDQTVSWTVADTAGGYPATGVAGFSQAWDSAFSDPTSEATQGSGNSFYSGPQFPNATSGYLQLSWAGQGCHYATVDAWDNSGITSYNQYYYYLCYDTIAPTAAAANSPVASSSGYNKSSVSVTLKSSDPGSSPSGIKQTFYAVDSTACTPTSLGSCAGYTGPVTISATGFHYVAYFTEDVAGNFSGESYDYIYIDEVAPVTTATLAGTKQGSNTNYDTAVKVTLSATDNYSGVQSTHYSLDGGATTTYSAPFNVAARGNHTVKFYSVDRAGNTEATKSVSFSITSQTSTVLTASPNPVVVGSSVTLTAKVTASLSGTPTGTITFKHGSATLGTKTLSGGEATFTTSSLPSGTDVLTAVYGGASTFLGSTSASVSEDVKQKTTTTVTSSLNPSVYGEKVTFTATVKPSGSGSPNGSVEFLDGTTVLGTGTLPSTGGKVSFSTTSLGGGTHSITAKYEGSSTYNGSTSSALSQVIQKAGVAATLTSSLNPSVFGKTVTFTATVSSTNGNPTGTVTFENNGTSIGTGTLSGGKATFATAALPVGTDSITAVYGGNTNFYGKTSAAISEKVTAASTSTKVGSSLNPSTAGTTVTFKATVTPASGPDASGKVAFKDGSTTLDTETLNSSGEATFATKSLSKGTHSITAEYYGSTSDSTSTSSKLSQVVK